MTRFLSFLAVLLLLFLPACAEETDATVTEVPAEETCPYPVFYGKESTALGEPFAELDLSDVPYKEKSPFFSPLTELGQAGPAYAVLGPETVDSSRRESIQEHVPTGFEQVDYPFLSNKRLYHRCHLIAVQLSSGTDVMQNLITGTEFLNLRGMKMIEDQIADYIRNTDEHILYRVIPRFWQEELVCRGVEMEAASLESDGLRIHVYCFNVEPGVMIDYSTGLSTLAATSGTVLEIYHPSEDGIKTYVLNTSRMRFHLPSCSSVENMKEKNKVVKTCTREELISLGYKPCGNCHP